MDNLTNNIDYDYWQTIIILLNFQLDIYKLLVMQNQNTLIFIVYLLLTNFNSLDTFCRMYVDYIHLDMYRKICHSELTWVSCSWVVIVGLPWTFNMHVLHSSNNVSPIIIIVTQSINLIQPCLFSDLFIDCLIWFLLLFVQCFSIQLQL